MGQVNITLVAAVTLFVLIAALVTDLRFRTIPNWLTLPYCASGFLFHAIAEGWTAAGEAAWGAAAGFLPLLVVYAMGGIGAGDVKLFGAAGVWLGVPAVLQLMMASIVYAGVIGMLLLACRSIPLEMIRKSVALVISADVPEVDASDESGTGSRRNWQRLRMPFMIAVVPAVATVWPAFP